MAAPIDLRNESVSLRRLAKRTRDATQSRRLLRWPRSTMVAAGRMRRGSAASVCRSFATGCCASTPADRTGWSMGKSPGAPSKLNADHRRALAEVVEAGPVPAVDGVVRWRRKDLARWLLETLFDETTVGRELKALGFAARRGRATRKTSWPSRLLKKTSPPNWRRSGRGSRVEIELWWQDEARIGQKNKRLGQTWHAPAGAPRPAHRMGLYLRRDLSREGERRRAGHALVRHRRHGGAPHRDQCRRRSRRPCGADRRSSCARRSPSPSWRAATAS